MYYLHSNIWKEAKQRYNPEHWVRDDGVSKMAAEEESYQSVTATPDYRTS